MKFSILVPVYNVEKYIEQCVDSLLSQSYQDFEIILVDDGSTDSSGEICDRYEKENPETIKVIHKKNQGLVSARDAGIKSASGDVAIFVDSDDFVESDLLATVTDSFKKHPDADMVIYSFSYYADGKCSQRKETVSDNEYVFDQSNKTELYSFLMFTSKVTSLWTKAVRIDVLRADSLDYSLYYKNNMAEDQFRSIQLFTKANKAVYINEPLYNYRTDNQSISRSFSPDKISKMNTLYVYDRFRECLPLWGMENKENINKLNNRWFNEVLYTFTSFYNGVKSYKDKRAVVDFNWDSMLPTDVLNGDFTVPDNEKGKLYNYVKSKRYFRIYLIFLKNNLYNFYKKYKRKN